MSAIRATVLPGSTIELFLCLDGFHLGLLLFFFFFFVFRLLMALRRAYGGSQAGGRIGAGAAGLHYSPQQHWILNPLSEARDRTFVLMDTCQIRFH